MELGRQQRNTALFVATALLAAEAFALCGWLKYTEDYVIYHVGSIAYYRVSYVTLMAVALLVAFVVIPAGRIKPLLNLLGRSPSLLPGAILTLGGGCFSYRIYPYWPFFVGGSVVAGALFFLLRREGCAFFDAALAWCGRARAFPVCVAIGTALGAFALNHALYGGRAHVVDSCARYAHVLMLSRGYWCYPPPPDWAWTVHNGMINDGVRYCSQYQPGGLLIGLLGHLAGSQALVAALIAGAVALLTYRVGRRLFDAQTAALGSVLLALSGNFLFLASSFMEHTPATLWLMAAFLLGLRDYERPRPWNAAALGFCVGCACMTRSVTSLGWAGPMLAVWAAMRWRRWQWKGVPAWGLALLGWLVPMAFFLYFNYRTTGSGAQPGYWQNNPEGRHSLGFTAANGHTPLRGLTNQWNNIWALSEWLFFWPATSYLFILALFFLGRWRRGDTLIALPALGLAAIHFFYPRQDFGFSPRQLSESIPLLALLTARGILELTAYLREAARRTARGVWRRSMLATLIVLFAIAVPNAAPKFQKEMYDQAGGVDALARALEPVHWMPNATVFLQGHLYAHRAIIDEIECWGGARFLEAPSIQERDAYVRAHPERRCFVVDNSNKLTYLPHE